MIVTRENFLFDVTDSYCVFLNFFSKLITVVNDVMILAGGPVAAKYKIIGIRDNQTGEISFSLL